MFEKQEGVIPPLKVEVWDKDALGDDSLGSLVIDVTPSIEVPCTWAIDDYFMIDDPKFKVNILEQDPNLIVSLRIGTFWFT